MEKAFDFAVLGGKLKAKGLDLAEEALALVVGETIDWVGESLLISKNKYVQFAAPLLVSVLPKIKEEALELVDKVDGEVG